MDTMKILVLGGAGYIGTKLCQDLRREHDVTSIDLEWFGSSVHHNIVDNYSYYRTQDLLEFDIVILLAAYASVSLASKDETKTLLNDCVNFHNLFNDLSQVSKKKRIKFIYASTGSVYGSQVGPCTEDRSKIESVSFYDLCKRFNDEYVLIHKPLVEFYGLRFGTVNGFSPHLRTDIMVNAMYYASKEKGVIQCASPYQYRGILDIADLSRGIKCIIDSEEDKRGIYNLSTFNATIYDIAKTVSNIVGCKIIMNDTQTTPYDFQLDCNKFHKAFPKFYISGSIGAIIESLEETPALRTVRNI